MTSTRRCGPVVVTGGAGFLGRRVVDQLLEADGLLAPSEVRVLDLAPGSRADVVHVRGDIRSREIVASALRGAELVIHCAASVDWGRESEDVLRAINVGGTENVMDACRSEGVPAMVHTSTLDVVYSGRPILDGDETLPYPERHLNAYCRTKTEAEKRVLAENGRGLATSVIRPCCIFGEGDPFHVEPLLEMARRGRLFRVGDGRARSQFSYAGNVAHALLLAGRALLEPERRGAGQAYFVTDCEPANFFDFVTPFVEAEGVRMPPASAGLPRAPLYALGALLEGASELARPFVRFTPTLTRFAVDFVCLDFTIRSDKLARELGYTPRFSPEEAIARTAEWHRARAREAART